jgi:hypothetical protein
LQGEVRGWEDICDIVQYGSESRTFERKCDLFPWFSVTYITQIIIIFKN